MPRPTPIALTEAEKRDLVTLIQQGQALPEKYRFVLFEDKREVELVWNGKTRDVCTNKLIWGDNKLILSSLKAGALRQRIEDAGGLKLIYIDPPFDVGADFSIAIGISGVGAK